MFYLLFASIIFVVISTTSIASGAAINLVSYPYIAYLKGNGNSTFSCAGTIIAKDDILTEESCALPHFLLGNITVYVGVTKEEDFDKKAQIRTGKELFAIETGRDLGIAIIKLDKDLDLIEGSVEIANIGLVENNQDVTAISWADDKPSTELQTTVFSVLEASKCGSQYGDKILCARAHKAQTNQCIGKRGGPVIQDNKVVGIVTKLVGPKLDNASENVCTDLPHVFVKLKKIVTFLSILMRNKLILN